MCSSMDAGVDLSEELQLLLPCVEGTVVDLPLAGSMGLKSTSNILHKIN